MWGKVDFTSKAYGGVCWRKEEWADEASFDKLELLIAHLLSQVVLLVQLALFICWWLQLWKQLHTPSFLQNKHVSCRRREEKWSAMCYINGSVSHSFFLVCEKKLNINHTCLECCANVKTFLYSVQLTLSCILLNVQYSGSATVSLHFVISDWLIDQKQKALTMVFSEWNLNLPLLFCRKCAVCWCLPNLLWPSLSMLALSNGKHKYIIASDLYLSCIKMWHS